MTTETSRRRVLQAGASAGALATLPAFAQSTPFSWRRYAGQSIEVHLIKSPRGELLQRNAGEFEALTGIKVGIDLVPEQQSRQKVTIEFNSKKPSFDVVQFGYHVQKRLFSRGKWLEDLRPYMAEAAAEFDKSDMLPSALATAVDPDGRWDGMPLNLDPFMLYTNKKLFAAKGVAVPKTMAELRQAAAKLHDPAAGIVGVVGRGLKNANVPLWAIFFLGAGGQYLNGNKLATDSAEAVAGATFYRDLLKSYGPAGISGFNWNEAQSLFLQGRAAMWIDSSGFSAPLEDPTKSKVVGGVGYHAMPMGLKKRLTVTFSDGIGVSSFSQKKGPAWYFVLWATSKNMQARLLSGGGGSAIRASASKNKAELAKINPEYLAALEESLKIAVPGLPIIEPVTEFRDTFGIALVNMLNGADPAAELKRATAEFQPVLDKSEGRA